MHIKITLAFIASTMGGAALADARYNPDLPIPPPAAPLLYAQVTVDALGDSDLRRLVFYSNRAMQALIAVIQGSENRDVVEQSKVNMAFRMSVARLVDAGDRSGLSIAQVTDFFTQNVAENFGQDFMQQVGAVANGLDFYALFKSVSFMRDPRSGGMDEGMMFLNALAQAASGMMSGGDAAEASAPSPVDASAPPVAGPNATALQRAIIDRVVVNKDRWEIEVIQGDSLAVYAGALYGNSLSYNVIYQANTDILSNPNTLSIGATIKLPKP